MLSFVRRLLRRRPAEDAHEDARLVSRAGQAVAGLRSGSQRHRPTTREQEFARRAGVGVHDPEERRL